MKQAYSYTRELKITFIGTKEYQMGNTCLSHLVFQKLPKDMNYCSYLKKLPLQYWEYHIETSTDIIYCNLLLTSSVSPVNLMILSHMSAETGPSLFVENGKGSHASKLLRSPSLQISHKVQWFLILNTFYLTYLIKSC